MEPAKEEILDAFLKSGKKHLLITGRRACGKTTLFNEIAHGLPGNEGAIRGITTYTIPGMYVMLKDNFTGDETVIGRVHKKDLVQDKNAMVPVREGFIRFGIPILESAVQSEQEWICIDEIGFLESENVRYQKVILEAFEKKRVMAIIRKQDLPFLNELKRRDDVYLVDMDEYGSKNTNM